MIEGLRFPFRNPSLVGDLECLYSVAAAAAAVAAAAAPVLFPGNSFFPVCAFHPLGGVDCRPIQENGHRKKSHRRENDQQRSGLEFEFYRWKNDQMKNCFLTVDNDVIDKSILGSSLYCFVC